MFYCKVHCYTVYLPYICSVKQTITAPRGTKLTQMENKQVKALAQKLQAKLEKFKSMEACKGNWEEIAKLILEEDEEWKLNGDEEEAVVTINEFIGRMFVTEETNHSDEPWWDADVEASDAVLAEIIKPYLN